MDIGFSRPRETPPRPSFGLWPGDQAVSLQSVNLLNEDLPDALVLLLLLPFPIFVPPTTLPSYGGGRLSTGPGALQLTFRDIPCDCTKAILCLEAVALDQRRDLSPQPAPCSDQSLVLHRRQSHNIGMDPSRFQNPIYLNISPLRHGEFPV